MANLTQTAANVKASAFASRPPRQYPAGVAIAAGQTIYLDSTGVWQLADADVALGVAVATAIAASSAGIGQLVDAVTDDPDLTHGLTGVVAGDTIWQSATAGAMTLTPDDNVSGMFVQVLGTAKSATKMDFRPTRGQVAK